MKFAATALYFVNYRKTRGILKVDLFHPGKFEIMPKAVLKTPVLFVGFAH
jgi:hypothetical protein